MTKRPIPAEIVREMRARIGVSPRALARLLACGPATIWRAEAEGAPQWLPLALVGLGMARYGLEPNELNECLGLEPDAGPYRGVKPPAHPVQAAVQCLAPPGATTRRPGRRGS